MVGYITQDGHTITFTEDNYVFTFISEKAKAITLKVDKNGYVYGELFDGKILAIYLKQNLEIYGYRVVNTWNYIICSTPFIKEGAFENIRGIQFNNGAVKSIFINRSLKRELSKEREIHGNNEEQLLVYSCHDDTVKLSISAEDIAELDNNHRDTSLECQFEIFSTISCSSSLGDGDAVSNSDVALKVIFPEVRELGSFYNYYGYISSIISFLTFRKNVFFEKITLFCDGQIQGLDLHFAECFVKKEHSYGERKIPQAMPVNWFNNNIFKNMFLSIALHNPKLLHGKYSDLPIDIFPLDEKDLPLINTGKIRSITTQIEIELNAAKIGKGKHLSARIIEAWEKYKYLIEELCSTRGIQLTDEKIIKYVKTRNNITHRGFKEIDIEVAEVTYAMYPLIVCMTMKRLGFSDEQIMTLFKRGYIG